MISCGRHCMHEVGITSQMLSDGPFCSFSQAYPPTEHRSSRGSFIWEHTCLQLFVFTVSFLLSSLLGRSVSPEAEIQGNPPSSSHRTRVSTSPMNYSAIHGSHEHYERIECTYIGSCEVSHGMGMETLNEAVDKLSAVSHRWLNVNVDVATSSIKISDSIVSGNHNIKLPTWQCSSYS